MHSLTKVKYMITVFLLLLFCLLNINSQVYVSKKTSSFKIDDSSANMVLYLPIAHEDVKNIGIIECNEKLVDMDKIKNKRIKARYSICPNKVKKSYPSSSKIRESVYRKLVDMLNFLPKNVGIAYQCAHRPISIQKKYFDAKFISIYLKSSDHNYAYQEASKYVSPYIDNVPPHSTGAAIDMTLFIIRDDNSEELMDMGPFATSCEQRKEETFSNNVTDIQKKNRMLMLNAAAKAGLVNYGYEWWHYSYGDKAWAYVTKATHAIYGTI